MSSAWHGGKGSESRISDHTSYRDGYDKIFKKKDMKKDVITKDCLMLDDVRIIEHCYLWDDATSLIDKSGIPSWHWTTVRSYDAFVDHITKNGIPDVVSFDNDLNVEDGRISIEEYTKLFQMVDWREFRIKTGAHCAEWLANRCIALKHPIPEYYVHSANSAARPIIREIMENAKQRI